MISHTICCRGREYYPLHVKKVKTGNTNQSQHQVSGSDYNCCSSIFTALIINDPESVLLYYSLTEKSLKCTSLTCLMKSKDCCIFCTPMYQIVLFNPKLEKKKKKKHHVHQISLKKFDKFLHPPPETFTHMLKLQSTFSAASVLKCRFVQNS